ncbi:MAG TPA: hypothetical protein VJ805_12030 [Nitrospiraceae bacterium]|nr:hypothetical protein [Nitrospiraceae bacterium]
MAASIMLGLFGLVQGYQARLFSPASEGGLRKQGGALCRPKESVRRIKPI